MRGLLLMFLGSEMVVLFWVLGQGRSSKYVVAGR